MRFAYPQFLGLLAALAVLLTWFLVWAWRKKQTLVTQFVQARLLPLLTVGVSPARQKTRLVLLGLAVVFALVALARPQWGYDWEEARQRGIDLAVAIDTSRSMLAEDTPPNRLARAKWAALDLLRLARGDRLALIPFAGTAFLQCPLTLDGEAFRQNVEVLDVRIMPQGGTALAEAIRIALTAFKDSGDSSKALVLISDGEDHDSGALAAAREAAAADVRIYTVGVGTPEGGVLRGPDAQGQLAYIKDADGQAVKSQLNESLLQQIAHETRGFYLPLRAADVIQTLYQEGPGHLAKSDVASRLVRRYHERFYWPLGLAVIFLLAELFLAEQRRGARAASPRPRAAAVSSAGIIPLASLSAAVFCVQASTADAERHYEAGRYEEARRAYEQLAANKPTDARLRYNAGTAAYRAEAFEQAARAFNEVTTAPDLRLQQRAYYNLGDAFYRLGERAADPGTRMTNWHQAVAGFDAAVKLDPADQDAQFNLEFVKQKLEELQRQNPPPQPQPQPDQKPQEDKDKKDDNQQQGTQSPPPQESPDQPEDQDSPSPSPKDQSSKQPPEPPKPQPGQDQPKDQPAEKPPAQPPAAQSKSPPPGQDQQGEPPPGGSSAVKGTPMTPQEAQQLLDAAKNEERPMIFVPQARRSNQSRILKDW